MAGAARRRGRDRMPIIETLETRSLLSSQSIGLGVESNMAPMPDEANPSKSANVSFEPEHTQWKAATPNQIVTMPSQTRTVMVRLTERDVVLSGVVVNGSAGDEFV